MENNFGIHSIGVSLPEKRISLEELCETYSIDFSTAKTKVNFVTKCIASRDDEHPSDFCYQASLDALKKLNLNKDDIGLVIYTGVSKDYLPSWTMAIEIIRRLNLKNAIGFDLTLGCVSSLIALKQQNPSNKNPFILICAAERWAHTLSEKVNFSIGTLAHADGGSACIIGPSANNRFGNLQGQTYPELNSYIFTPAGGTKEPFSEESLKNNRHFRQRGTADINIVDHYISSYDNVVNGCLRANSLKRDDPQYYIINQVRDSMRSQILAKLGIALEKSPYTYGQLGHLGSADLFISLDRVLASVKSGNSIMASSSTPSVYAALPIFFS